MDKLSIGSTAPPLWHSILEIVHEFDSSREPSRSFLRFAYSPDAYPLEDEEIDALPNNLRDYQSPVWLREAVVVYLDYLGIMISRIRGEGSSIVLPDDIAAVDNLHELQSDWLSSVELRMAIADLVGALEQALYYFNIQLVAVRTARCFKRSLVGIPDICKGIDPDEGAAIALQLEDVAHGHGKAAYGGGCHAAFGTLSTVVNVREATRTLFEFTHEQLMNLVLLRWGMRSEDCFERMFSSSVQDTSHQRIWNETPLGIMYLT